MGPFTRHSIENTRNALGDVVADDISHEERSQDNTYNGVEQIEEVVCVDIEPIYQSALDKVQQHLEEVCCHTSQGSHHHSENEQHLSLAQPLCDVEKPMIDLLSIDFAYVVGTLYHNLLRIEN
jgi:hypothetical protein